MTLEFFRQSTAYFVARLTPAIMVIPALAIYTRVLSPSEYGVYVTAITVVGFGHSTVLSWLWTVALRLYYRDDATGTLRSGLLLCFGAMAAVAAFVAAGVLFRFPTSANLVVLSFIAFLTIGWLEMNLSMLRARIAVNAFLWASVARSVLATAISIVLVLAGEGAEGLLAGAAIGSALPAIFLISRHWKGLPDRQPVHGALKEILQFGAPLAVGFSAEAVSVNADRLLLRALRDTAAVGQYGASYGLASRLVSVALDPIGNAGFSLAVRALERDGQKAAAGQVRANLLYLMLVGLPFVVGAILVTPQLAAILIGSEYREMALALIPILLATCFLISLRNHFCEALFQLARRTRPYAYITTGVALFAVAAIVLLVPKFGALGAAYATLATHALAFVATAYFGMRLFPFQLPVRDLLKVAMATALMALAVLLVPPHRGVVSLLAQALIGAVVYPAGLLALNVDQVRSAMVARLRARFV
jgi:O-antigen/teichoic acid export membrane protein